MKTAEIRRQKGLKMRIPGKKSIIASAAIAVVIYAETMLSGITPEVAVSSLSVMTATMN